MAEHDKPRSKTMYQFLKMISLHVTLSDNWASHGTRGGHLCSKSLSVPLEHTLHQQMPRLPNAKNTLTSFIITAQLQSKPLVCMESPLPILWVALQRKLLRHVTPGNDSVSTSTYLWLWLWGNMAAC